MITGHVEQAAAALVREIAHGAIRCTHRLAGGRNNRVYRLETDAGPLLLKHYHHDADDGRDRGAAEFEFANFAWAGGIRCIPQPLAIDHTFHLALFEFVDGLGTGAAPIDSGDVAQALAFFRALNDLRAMPASGALRFAAEACFSADDHLAVVASRMRRAAQIAATDDLGREAADFVAEQLQPSWHRIETRVAKALFAIPQAAAILPREQRCLSPSDFGFHNALRRPDGHLVFHDFEYGGWDDPAKTVCDFFCQPQITVPLACWDEFVAGVDAAVGADSRLGERARLLLDVYRIKWCCIVLNEFQPAGLLRRDFAGDPEQGHARRKRSLATAASLLATIDDRGHS